MASFNRKVENFLQPLGESYFTRNQVLYSVLLAIKNAFWVDKARNLQKLRKRRNNTTWYFARMGNKARKILDVVQAVRKQFFQKAGKIAVAVPFVFTGLAGQGNGEPLTPQELHQLALNTKPKHEIVLKKEEIPQNPVTTSPLFKKAALEPEKECGGKKSDSPHVCALNEAIAFSLKHKKGVAIYVNYAAQPELAPEILEGSLVTALQEEKIKDYKITSSFSKDGEATVMQIIIDGTPVMDVFVNAEARDRLTEAASIARGESVLKTSSVNLTQQ